MLIAHPLTPLKYINEEKGEGAMREHAARCVGHVTPGLDKVSREGLKMVMKENEAVERAIEVFRKNEGIDALELLETAAGKIRQIINVELCESDIKFTEKGRLIGAMVHQGILPKIQKQKIEIIKLMRQQQAILLAQSQSGEEPEPETDALRDAQEQQDNDDYFSPDE